MRVTATASLRLDLAGGTLDIWPLCHLLREGAVTVNAALDLPASASATRLDGQARVHLRSEDQDVEVTYPDSVALAEALVGGTCPLALLGEAVRTAFPAGGVKLTTQAAGPAGAGLGGSSALLVACLGSLEALAGGGGPALDEAILLRAQNLETRVLGTPTGYQDYYPPAFGGLLALEAKPQGVAWERLATDLGLLESRLLLADTGRSHHSGQTNWGVLRAFLDGDRRTRAALLAIATNSRQVRQAFRRGDLDGALEGALADGALRCGMSAGVEAPEALELNAQALRAGAMGTKILGAGGGGFLLVVLRRSDHRDRVARDLERAGIRVRPVRISPAGLALQTTP